jgi:hypothetical protein
MQSIWCEYLLIMGAHRTQLTSRTKHAYMHLVAASKKKIKVGHGIYIAIYLFCIYLVSHVMFVRNFVLVIISIRFGFYSKRSDGVVGQSI